MVYWICCSHWDLKDLDSGPPAWMEW